MEKGTTKAAPETEKTGKNVPPTKPVRGKNGGARPGSGRKKKEDREVQKTLTEIAESHACEVVEVQIIHKATNTVEIVRKTRSEAILDMLYSESVNKKNIAAAKEYHDRTRGKPKQELEHSGEIKTETQRQPTKAELAAAQAYEGTA